MALQFHNADHPFRCPQRRLIRKWIHDFARFHQKQVGEIGVIFCSDEYLLELNKAHLDHDYYTDIITFDYCDEASISGELYISIDRVKDNAKTHKSLFIKELMRVIIHGHLHLVGFKDKTKSEKTTMRQQEDEWIRAFELIDS